MPTYDYTCKSCGHTLELFQQMTDKPIKKCPQCGTNKLQRQIGGGAGIIFKGSGFYATDYRKGSPSKDSKDSKSTQPPASPPPKTGDSKSGNDAN